MKRFDKECKVLSFCQLIVLKFIKIISVINMTFLNELSAILKEIERLGKVITLSTEMKIWIIHCKTTLQVYDIVG